MSLRRVWSLTATVMLVTSASAQSCSLAKQKFNEVTTELHVGFNGENKDRILTKQSHQTTQAVEIIRAGILEILNKGEDPIQPGKVTSYIQCVQDSPIYEGWDSIINTPQAFLSNETGQQVLTVAYFVYRGPFPAGIPDTLPFVDFFVKKDQRWRLLNSTGSDYRAFTFQIDKISSGIPKQDWFLLSGFHIGDTGTRLMLEIVAFDGGSIKTIWKLADLKHTTLDENHKDYIILSQYKGFAGGQDVYQHIRWDVAPDGLKRKD